MSNVERTAFFAGRTTTGEYLATGLLAVALLSFVAAWATVFQWVDESATYLGVTHFEWLGTALLALGIGLIASGFGTRAGYFGGTPSRHAGAAAALVFGLLWGAIAALLAAWLIGGGTLVWAPAALLGGGVAAVATLGLREDIASTVPPAVLLVLAGGVIATGRIDAAWMWEPEWLSARFPGSEVVPVVTSLGALLGAWSAAKARAGFGPQGRESGAVTLIGTAVFGMLGILGLLIGFIVVNGLDTMLTGASPTGGQLTIPLIGVTVPWIHLPFVGQVTGGLYVEIPGVMPAIVGTLWLVVGAVAVAVPMGVGAAIFLTEYAEQGRFVRLVEVATNGLWSTPSIVFGLFGLAFLVPRISGGRSIVVGQLVLSFMLLPLVLITSRESIKAVPDEYRDASAALGVTRWQTIRSVVIPAAMPGVITGVILGVGRIAGETAPLLLVFGGPPFPTSSADVLGSFEVSAQPPFITNEALVSPASALPYQLYSSITAGQFPKEIFTDTEFGWGTALVLLLVVMGLYAIGVASRLYFRRKLHHE